MTHGKKYLNALKQVNANESLSVNQAFEKIKNVAHAKFDETVDAHIRLGIDADKGDQVVRGSVLLPHGRGKKVKVIVFARGAYADAAEKAGADFVGVEELVEKINKGWLDFDFAVATPDLMGVVGTLAKILGPRGLLPNKKVGTVTFEVAQTVAELKKGRQFFKNDKSGQVNFSFGKTSFEAQQLAENFRHFIKALVAAKPATAKGRYLRSITVAPTMGPGVLVNVEDALKAELKG